MYTLFQMLLQFCSSSSVLFITIQVSMWNRRVEQYNANYKLLKMLPKIVYDHRK